MLDFNIAAVERETGLSKDVLRMWERRYGFPVPERDANGERLYPAAQVERLRGQYPHIAFALAEYFGFDAGIFHILDTRVADALAGTATAGLLECDGCKYREAAEEEHLHDHSHTATGGCGHTHAHQDHANHPHDHSHCQHAKS